MLLILLSLFGIILSFFKPNLTLFWSKKNVTRKKSLLIYSTAFFISFILFGISTENNKQNITPQENGNTELGKKNNKENIPNDIPDILNAEILKKDFSNPPYNFKYWKLSEFNDTNHTYKGYKNQDSINNSKDDNIIIQFDPTTSEIYYVGLYCQTTNTDVTFENVKKISDFAGYFDNRAVEYLADNFNNIFINDNVYPDSSEFRFDDRILFSVTHDFITTKKIIKRDGKGAINSPLNFAIEIQNRNKKLL